MNTLFIGQNRINLDHVDSTNNYLAKSEKLTNLPEGTVILAEHQTAGKGQRKNFWLSEKGKNLTMSVLLKPKTLKPDNYFILNKAVTLAVVSTIEHFVSQEVMVKWPNDVLVLNKKISGILIELAWRATECQSAIVGVGMNVNQADFGDLLHATSIANLTNKAVSLEEVLTIFCENLEFQYLNYMQDKWDAITLNYNKKLWRRGELITFICNGVKMEAVLKRVGNDGRIYIENMGKELSFQRGEISIEYLLNNP